MKNKQPTSTFLGVAAAAVLATNAYAGIINVPGDQPTIQAGINASVDGDEVVVADGVYAGPGNKNLDFQGRLITVRSANGPDNCVIDCESAGRGFIFQTGETEEAVVEGFTVRSGFDGFLFGGGMSILFSSPTVVNCVFRGNHAGSGGGAISSQLGSNPTVIDCMFIGNSADLHGGAIFVGSNDGSSVTVINCAFTGNSAANGGGGNGGGIFVGFGGGSAPITDSVFSGNMAVNGGAIFYVGSRSLLRVDRCTFQDNSAIGDGGGIWGSHTLPTDCVFSGNTAVGRGGAANLTDTSAVTNCTFTGNSAGELGGALKSPDPIEIVNSTFSGNFAGRVGGIFNGNVTNIVNCILWGNADNGGSDQTAQVNQFFSNVTYSCVQGLVDGGTGNIGNNPFFVDPYGPDGLPGGGDDDLRLLPGSPCIDAGDNTAVPEGITTDLDGNPRFVDDPDTPDTGNPGPPGPIVDMGAYEFQRAGCHTDVNGDGVVNVLDLIGLLLCFGQPAIPGCGAEDVNQDGSVDVLDLIELLLAFGTACP